MKTLYWWLGLVFLYSILMNGGVCSYRTEGWEYLWNLFDERCASFLSILLEILIIVIPMWWAHENLGWFGTSRHPDPYYGDDDAYHGIKR